MARFKVVVTDYVFESFEIEREILAAADAALEVCQCKSIPELLTHLPGTHGLLTTYLPGIGREVFEKASELKVVVRYGLGTDTIDLAEATRHGVRVANVPDSSQEQN